MSNGISKSSNLQTFVQSIYGVIIGLSFLKFDFSKKEWLFDLVIYGFTFLVAAHDWAVYHRHEKIKKDKFIFYIFQFGSVLSMGLMFNSANYENMVYWFIAGSAYTVFNFLNLLVTRNSKPFIIAAVVSYIIHLGVAWYFGCKVYEKSYGSITINFFDNYQWIALIATSIIVILIWIFKPLIVYECEKKINETAPSPKIVALVTPIVDAVSLSYNRDDIQKMVIEKLQELENSNKKEVKRLEAELSKAKLDFSKKKATNT